MNIAIIGSGLIGNKRANAIENDDRIILACDIDINKAKTLAKTYNCHFTTDYRDVSLNSEVEAVIVATINESLMPISINMLNNTKHVLCEKPLGRNAEESLTIIDAATLNNRKIKTGFNHRFHPSIIKAKDIINSEEMGKVLNIRCRYGHGGRKGMEEEWRCSKILSGGGELLDQGVHIIDLTRWFLNEDINEVSGNLFTSFWDIEVEDNAFFNLRSNNILIQCHVSWTNWKNIFSYEVFFEKGYIILNGLGGSYGIETLEIGQRNSEGGRPIIKKYTFDQPDTSWNLEWLNFKSGIENESPIIGTGLDGYKANKIIDAIYESNKINSPILL